MNVIFFKCTRSLCIQELPVELQQNATLVHFEASLDLFCSVVENFYRTHS